MSEYLKHSGIEIPHLSTQLRLSSDPNYRVDAKVPISSQNEFNRIYLSRRATLKLALASLFRPNNPRTTKNLLEKEGLQNTPDTRIAFIADIGLFHGSSDRVAYWMKMLEPPPDLLILGGDVSYSDSGLSYKPILGMYDWLITKGIYGDHDAEINKGRSLMAHFSEFQHDKFFYDHRILNIHLFFLDSYLALRNFNFLEEQKEWLRANLSSSLAKWKLVVSHHPPYSLGKHGSYPSLQLPYKDWGADAVLSGDNHLECVRIPDILYFTNGGGGAPLIPVGNVTSDTLIAHEGVHSILLIDSFEKKLVFKYVTQNQETNALTTISEFSLTK